MAAIEIRNLRLDLRESENVLRVIENLSLSIDEEEIVSLVGESGSGKSLTALSLVRLIACPPARFSGGEILVDGRDVLQMTKAELRAIRGRVVSYVFQEPGASLNPVLTVGQQIKEVLRLHCSEEARDEDVGRLLRLVKIPDPQLRMNDYPYRLSGGVQQRVVLAMALAARPRLLVADEATTALDATVQTQILDLLKELRDKLGMAILLITHHLGVVRDIADRVAVMYAGQIVEMGPTKTLLLRPLHPYTRGLIECVPRLGATAGHLRAIPGQVPRLGSYPQGCRFHPRCAWAQSDCSTREPDLEEIEPGHWVRCPYWKLTSTDTGHEHR
ncbi:MAG: ABC transporter ATP-binding protein [Verrucomicrobia bacterium]|nr:ABC transporter ATP-binding protein [Verrucomicrobiota bacterium]